MFGSKIRRIRLEKQLSLRELAKKTGLTPSFISQVERGLADPSVTSLRKIAEALDVPIFYFLLDSHTSNPVVRRDRRKVLRLPDSHLVFELLSPDLDKSMELMVARLAPGAVSCAEPMAHPGEECILVLQGAMEITVGGQTYTMGGGDSIYYNCTQPHQLKNVGDEELVFLSAITPPRF